jgi:polysaccharide pyruvyl transferase WcaK-like protein
LISFAKIKDALPAALRQDNLWSRLRGAKKICIVNFTGDRQNWGCQATSWEFLKFIMGAFPRGNLPKVSFIPLLPRCDIDAELSDRFLRDIYDAIHTVAGNRTGAGSALRLLESICVSRYGFWIEEVRSSDVVLFQGEGTMTGSDFVRGARLILLPFVAKHAWGKPLLALNQTIFSCDAAFSAAAAAAYNSFDFVAVRENVSFDAAGALGIAAYHIPDLAFLAKAAPHPEIPVRAHHEYFCVTGTALPSSDAHEQLFSLADQVRRASGLRPLIAASTAADQRLEQLAAAAWGNEAYDVVPRKLSYLGAASAMSRCKFVVGGRYHMSIIAASMGVPSILLRGNSYKNEGLAAMLQGSLRVRPLDDEAGVLADMRVWTEGGDSPHVAFRSSVEAVMASIEAAKNWFTSALQGGKAKLPDCFSKPPGSPISAEAHLEPYCTWAREQAATFAYPVLPAQKRYGKPVSPDAFLAPLFSALEVDREGSAAIIKQVVASSPKIFEPVSVETRHRIEQALSHHTPQQPS